MNKQEPIVQGDMAEHKTEGDYKRDKFVSLFKARTILSKIGTMAERQMCRKQLKRMKKLGVKSL